VLLAMLKTVRSRFQMRLWWVSSHLLLLVYPFRIKGSYSTVAKESVVKPFLITRPHLL
jgi:hypothetical protein